MQEKLKVPVLLFSVVLLGIVALVLPYTANLQSTTTQQVTYTVKVGDTVAVDGGFAFTLTDLTPNVVTFDISKNGNPLQTGATFNLQQARTVYGITVTYTQFQAPSAKIVMVYTAPEISQATAISIFNQRSNNHYPATSIVTTEAPCPGDKDSLCFVISAGKIEENQAGVVQSESGPFEVQNYKFIDARITYIRQSDGKVLSDIHTT